MTLRFLQLWERMRSSYWFVPSIMSSLAALLAVGLFLVDKEAREQYLPFLSDLYVMDAPGAQAILSTLASSSITVAGVVFSIAMLVLSNASAQFGPRLLPNFMRQGGTQVVLGGFIGTFVYCLIVLTRVRATDDGAEIPHLSVSVALLFGVSSFGLLIYFIHRVATFIQAPNVVEYVGSRLIETFAKLFPEAPDNGRVVPQGTIYYDDGEGEIPILQSRSGQIQMSSNDFEVLDSDAPIAYPIASGIVSVSRGFSFQAAGLSDDVLALFTFTTPSTLTQVEGSVTGETMTIKAGRSYQLGVDATHPTGVRNVSAVAFVDTANVPLDQTKFTVDAVLGRFTVSASYAGAANIKINYTKAAASRVQLAEQELKTLKGAFRFIAANINGPNRDIYLPAAQLAPDGNWDLKLDVGQRKEQVIGFKGKFYPPEDGRSAIYVDGRPA